MTIDEAIQATKLLRARHQRMFACNRDAQVGSDLDLADEYAVQIEAYLLDIMRHVCGSYRIPPMPTPDFMNKTQAPELPAERG